MKYDALFIANSAYSLYLYLALRPELIQKTLFVCGPDIANNNLPHKIKLNIAPKTKKEEANYQEFLLRKVKHQLGGKSVPCYAHLTTPYAEGFLGHYPLYALSDGLGDGKLFLKCSSDKRITGCYATDLEQLGNNEEGYGRLKIINPSGIWDKLNKEEQDNIRAVFGVHKKTCNLLKQKKGIPLNFPKKQIERDM